MRLCGRFFNNNFFCCLIIFFVIFMLALATFCFCQTMDVSITAYYQSPVATYLETRLKRFVDGDNTSFCLDPAGTSTLHKIRVLQTSAAATNAGYVYIQGTIRGTTTSYNISLQLPITGPGYAYLQSINTSGRITMGAISAGSFYADPTKGKTVYDLAEGITADNCDDCDVVIISACKDLTVEKSNRSFDPLVAGVISENPKLYLGALPGFKPLALAGVVKCNVSAENGPIKKGDLLVTSATPGHAMRASSGEVGPGMVLGSALEDLESGAGKIYILVNQ